MRRLAAALVVVGFGLAGAATSLSAAEGLQVRFYPSKALRTYELEGQRGWQGALLQNFAIVNVSAAAITVEKVDVELLQGDEVVQTQRLSTADLDRAAKKGAGLQQAGYLDLLSFQFRPDVLLAGAKTLSRERSLASGSSLLVGHRFLAFNGAPDRLRVRVFAASAGGRTLTTETDLPIVIGTSKTEYHFPLAGGWFVGAGQGLHDHHRWAVPEEFALDIARLGEGGTTHRGDGSKRTDYYAYGAEVLAAADGVVVSVVDSLPESDSGLRQPGESAEAYEQRILAQQGEILAKGMLQAAGNHVVIAHAGDEFSFYAHLQPGSIKVKKGDPVKRGAVLGRLGHSGNSTEPHLHFHVTDGPDPLLSAGIPVRFANVTLPFALSNRAIQSGDLVEATAR